MRQAYIPVALTSTAVLVGLQCTLTADWWMTGLCAMIVVMMVADRHVGIGDTPPTDVLAISPNTGAIPPLLEDL